MQCPSCPHPDADDMLVLANEKAARDESDQSDADIPGPRTSTPTPSQNACSHGMKINVAKWKFR